MSISRLCKTGESKEANKRTSILFRQAAKRRGVLPLFADIREKLNPELNSDIFVLIIQREVPEFFEEHYRNDPDYAIYSQLTAYLPSREVTHLVEKGIRSLHLELFGERDLIQEFKNKGWKV